MERNKNSKKNNILEKIINFINKTHFKRFIYKFYYYVPPCPVCNSNMTGKFMRELSSKYENDWRLKTCLKNGEIIASSSTNKNTCFCLNCGNEWNGTISLKLWNKDKISEQKKIRKTDIMLENLNNEKMAENNKKRGIFAKYMGHF